MFSNTTRDLHDGFQRWFKRQNQIPRKKKRTWAQSATSNAINGNIKVLDATICKYRAWGVSLSGLGVYQQAELSS
jgi:hypothetical protein